MYYRIRNSLNNKIIGHYCQIEQATLTQGWDYDPLFVGNISFKKVDFKPKTPIGLLHKKAKVTDLLSTVPPGFTPKLLISENLKNLLKSFDEDLFQFFQCDVESKDLTYEYWIASPLRTGLDLLDFSKSRIVQRKRSPGIPSFLVDIELAHKADFDALLDSLDPMDYIDTFISTIHFKEEVTDDIIVLPNVVGGIGYYVSERFKSALDVHEISGIELAPSNVTLDEWHMNERTTVYGKA